MTGKRWAYRCLLGFLFPLLAMTVIAQTSAVKGIIKDEKGKPVDGVMVIVQNKAKTFTKTTESDTSGTFRFGKLAGQGTYSFTFSSIGFGKKVMDGYSYNPGEVITLSVQLAGQSSQLSEVVVVGYGTEKKANLTGAVSQVNSEALTNRPMANAARGLEGLIPNLNIVMTDGKPTRSPSYNVRGTTSIGSGGSALVLIDGVPGDPGLLNPNDIESVTVLKDAASAAIYGARGAYGVVLFTTKSPKKGRTQLNFNTNYTFNQRTVNPHTVNDGYEWTKNFDSAYLAWYDYLSAPTSINGILPFTQQYMDSLKARHDNPSLPKVTVDPATGKYNYYGSTDWYHELYTDYMPQMEEALSVSGSNEKADFLISGRYYSQGGIFRYHTDKFKRYNLRVKGDIHLAPWFTVSDNIDFNSYNYYYPVVNGGSPIWRYMDVASVPVGVMFNPDGSLTPSSYTGVGDLWTGNNSQTTKQIFFRNTASFNADIIKNVLNLKGDLTYAYTNNVLTGKYFPITYSAGPGITGSNSNNYLAQTTNVTKYYAANLYAQFNKTFGWHSVKLLLGSNIEDSRDEPAYMRRDGLLDPSLANFNLLNGQNYTITGGGSEWAIAGFFFRGNYAYKDKYLFEINGRYDGSSKFPSYSRFGLFPSISAGWFVSKEPFMNFSKGFLDNLKIRASFGSLGNGQLNNPYQFVSSMSISQNTGFAINGAYPTYTSNPAVLPNGLTWETSSTYDGGLDFNLFHNKLSGSFDYYQRFTRNMFTVSQPLPGVYGAAVPYGNYASLKTLGWELTLNWKDKINGDWSYGVGLVLSDYKAYITKYNNPNGILPYNTTTYYKGERLGEMWGMVNDGYFTQADISGKHNDQSYIVVSNANVILPGDIKFKDLNGDGKINIGQSTLADHGDLKVIGNSLPRYSYGITTNLSWKALSFSAFFQGIGHQDWWPGTEAAYFWGQYNRPYESVPSEMMKNVWSPENPNAYFPRYRGYVALQGTRELVIPQTKYLQNVAYIRLKNVNLTWTMPNKWFSLLKLTSAQLYFTGQNLFTLSPLYKHTKSFDPEVIYGADPEVSSGAGNGYDYPMLKSYTFGLNITL